MLVCTHTQQVQRCLPGKPEAHVRKCLLSRSADQIIKKCMRTKQGSQNNGAQRRCRNGTPPAPFDILSETPTLRACLRQCYTSVSEWTGKKKSRGLANQEALQGPYPPSALPAMTKNAQQAESLARRLSRQYNSGALHIARRTRLLFRARELLLGKRHLTLRLGVRLLRDAPRLARHRRVVAVAPGAARCAACQAHSSSRRRPTRHSLYQCAFPYSWLQPTTRRTNSSASALRAAKTVTRLLLAAHACATRLPEQLGEHRYITVHL